MTPSEYQNPILCADYSDPDIVRVGDDFFMVFSSFNHVVARRFFLHQKAIIIAFSAKCSLHDAKVIAFRKQTDKSLNIDSLPLYKRVVMANIIDSKCHDPDNSDIVKVFTLDRFSIFGNQ